MKEIFLENKNFIRQILRLSKSELIKRYKGAALGPAWSVIQPAITIFVYWFAFQLGLRASSTVRGVDFFTFLMTGMVPWFFMKDAILGGANCFRANKAFITKMPFPVSAIPTFKLLSALYSNMVLFVIMYIILLFSGVTPRLLHLQVFFYIALMFFCFLFLSWITAPLSAISKDFLNIVRAVITAIFWLSGIIYDPYSMTNALLGKIIGCTPVAYFSNGIRDSLLYGTKFYERPVELACCIGWMVLLAILGACVYKKLRKTIPDML